MELFQTYQPYMLFGCGFTCVILGIYAAIIDFHSLRKKFALVKLLICVGVMLIGDGFAFKYDAIPGNRERIILILSEFVVYTCTLASIFFLSEYLTSHFMEGGKFKKLPKRLLLGFIVPTVGISLVVISQFTGIYYHYDENNEYARGTLYFLGFIIPFVAVIILFSFIFQYRKMISKRILWSVLLFTFLPIIAAIIQFFIYGITFINFASWLAALALFGCALQEQNEELSKAANTDIQTGLPNTFGYLHEVDRIIHFQDITNYNAYYFDIVRMNNFNNKYSKPKGDEIILKYAKAFRDRLDKDEIVGRLGGNFFVALVKKSNTEKFREMLSDTVVEIEFEGHIERVHVSAVAGGYEIKKRNIAAGQILGYTSTTISYAKNVAHKPYVMLDEELEREFARRSLLEDRIKKALENKEFEPFYQPKVDSWGNILCGAEALCRWRKDGSLVPPYDFIPTMERNGSICNLDFYILERVCLDIKEWLERGITPVPVSVNFSRKNLGNPILSEAISKVVEKVGIPKKYIQIEITETIDEFPLSYLIGVVEALQRYDLTVAIDDFGTGSSSIGLLKEVRFDTLKIDKSFVDCESALDKELLADIIHMAKNRKMDVIAEGVEKMEQVEELMKMECFVIQGYVFDKPLEKSEFENRLINKQYSIHKD